MRAPDPLIIGFAGKAGSGKDTAAAHLVQRYGFHRFAFADPLREMLFALLDQAGACHSHATDPALKERPIPGLGVSYRKLAQTLGTEWARAHFGDDFWLRTAELALGLTSARGDWPGAPVHDRIVIPDVRFRNELAWVNRMGGVVIHLARPQAAEVRHHLSEFQLDGVPMWAHVNNAETIERLHDMLDQLLAKLHINRRERMASLAEECAP